MSGLQGRENVYTCQKCGGRVTTIDRDEGVTPFMIGHREVGSDCKGLMHSAFYPEGPRPSHIAAPTYEWYKPDEQEYKTLRRASKEHVDKGGLLLRRILP